MTPLSFATSGPVQRAGRRLREFRRGCETLINAPHTQLSEEDREWLIKRCREWKKKIAEHERTLRSGAKTVEEVRSDADETVRKLMAALRKRATT